MGRGRAKAKQTKVARQLKYSTPHTDFDSLQRELSGSEDSADRRDPVDEWADEDEWRRA
ncbi:DUF3073 family protein [Gordonia sp. HNM0687]|uniref:DUF3073 family protein n=1 Tax=Gordonia mangrovi TaxID=2665643 RepID=A0A6L7GUR8_9ACTN|nr:DUF3073 domain-containing protein [Gordonia mangrovi]MDY6810451.1 DUF3073 domain-containing protein [Actinomycetota bacterium]MXP23252.1 DUF3073 family protein [Gordonia mangrovi]UVF76828.1 DUF3073 domain-containing protein [Gordonia mangrovi]